MYFEVDDCREELACLIRAGHGFSVAREKLGLDFSVGEGVYYVYALIDPRNDSVFYIGKGKGARMRSHAKNAKKGEVDNAEKHKRIVSILDDGLSVREEVIYKTNLEAEAFHVEKFFITELKDCGLTNISNGTSSNEELEIEKAQALRRKIAPLDWLEKHPDADFIAVFGSMAKFTNLCTLPLMM